MSKKENPSAMEEQEKKTEEQPQEVTEEYRQEEETETYTVTREQMEKMEQLAGEVITTLEQTEQGSRESRLDLLLHEWRFGGAIDRDEVLIHLERRLGELSKLLGLSEDRVFEGLEHERRLLTERVRHEHPELAEFLSKHRIEIEEHFKDKYPLAAAHIAELREKHEHAEEQSDNE